MRAIALIVCTNLLAFALGGVVTLWLAATPLPSATLASTSVLSTPANAAALPIAKAAPPPPDATPAAPTPAVPSTPTPTPTNATAPAPVVSPQATPQRQVAAVAMPPVVATDAPATNSTSSAAYMLQLGAFLVPDDATRLRAALAGHGYSADIVAITLRGKAWKMVRILGLADRVSAQRTAAALRRDTGVAGLVMRVSTP